MVQGTVCADYRLPVSLLLDHDHLIIYVNYSAYLVSCPDVYVYYRGLPASERTPKSKARDFPQGIVRSKYSENTWSPTPPRAYFAPDVIQQVDRAKALRNFDSAWLTRARFILSTSAAMRLAPDQLMMCQRLHPCSQGWFEVLLCATVVVVAAVRSLSLSFHLASFCAIRSAPADLQSITLRAHVRVLRVHRCG